MNSIVAMFVATIVLILSLGMGIAYRLKQDHAACTKQGGVFLPNEGICVRGVEILRRGT